MHTNTSVKVKGVQLSHGLLPRHIFTCKDRIKSKFAARHSKLNYSPASVSPVFCSSLTRKVLSLPAHGGQLSEGECCFSALVSASACTHGHMRLYDLLNFAC